MFRQNKRRRTRKKAGMGFTYWFILMLSVGLLVYLFYCYGAEKSELNSPSQRVEQLYN